MLVTKRTEHKNTVETHSLVQKTRTSPLCWTPVCSEIQLKAAKTFCEDAPGDDRLCLLLLEISDEGFVFLCV